MSSSSLGVHASITDDQNNRVGYSQCTLAPGAGALYAELIAASIGSLSFSGRDSKLAIVSKF